MNLKNKQIPNLKTYFRNKQHSSRLRNAIVLADMQYSSFNLSTLEEHIILKILMQEGIHMKASTEEAQN